MNILTDQINNHNLEFEMPESKVNRKANNIIIYFYFFSFFMITLVTFYLIMLLLILIYFSNSNSIRSKTNGSNFIVICSQKLIYLFSFFRKFN